MKRTVIGTPLWTLLASLLASAHLAVAPQLTEAQSRGREPAVVEVPASTRAVALGHSFQLDAIDTDVVFFNPALVGRGTGMMLSYHRFGSAATGLALSAGTAWFGGGVGLGIQTLEYGGPGAGSRPAGMDPLLQEGPTGMAEQVAVAAYSRTVGPVRVGVAGKLLSQRVADDHDTRAALDVGVAKSVGPVWMGLSARNLGGDYVIDGAEVSLPEEVTLGVGGYGQQVGPLDLGMAASVTRRADGEWLAGGGLEVGYWPVSGRTFVGRVGLRNVPEGDLAPLTFGASFWGDDLVLEYAFQPVSSADGIHRVTVGWR